MSEQISVTSTAMEIEAEIKQRQENLRARIEKQFKAAKGKKRVVTVKLKEEEHTGVFCPIAQEYRRSGCEVSHNPYKMTLTLVKEKA